MKVAFFQFFPPTIWTPGGGETQLAKTRHALEKLGVRVDFFDIWARRRDYDIMHIFGSTYQLSDFAVTARRLGMKLVVSPIVYTNKPEWKWRAWRFIDRFMPVPTGYTYRNRIYEAAHVLLPGSDEEAAQLHTNFCVPLHNMTIVRNAADAGLAEATGDLFAKKHELQDFVLMVARISRHKGQVRLINALDGQGLDLVFLGQMDPDDPDYFREFERACEGKPWVHHLGFISNEEELASAYAAARVHALPSFSECPGLASLEAGLAGANVVAVKAPTVFEHLGDEAFYCNPSSIDSIRDAVIRAYEAPLNGRLRERLLADFTWDAVAAKMLDVYEKVLRKM